MPGIGLRRKTQETGRSESALFLLRIVAQCQEKPIDEAFPILTAHAAMVVDVAFKVGEDAFQPVVCVRHPFYLLPREQIGQVKPDADHSRAQSPVRVECMAGFGVDRPLFQESIPLQDPSLESRIKGVPVAGCQRGHERLQFTACRKARVPREFSSDDGAHVVLAHLHLVILEKRE